MLSGHKSEKIDDERKVGIYTVILHIEAKFLDKTCTM